MTNQYNMQRLYLRLPGIFHAATRIESSTDTYLTRALMMVNGDMSVSHSGYAK